MKIAGLLLIKEYPLPTNLRSVAFNFMGKGGSNGEKQCLNFWTYWAMRLRSFSVRKENTWVNALYNLNFTAFLLLQNGLEKFLRRLGMESW